MPTTSGQDKGFAKNLDNLLSDSIRDAVVSAFKGLTYDWVLDWVFENFKPSDVFDDKRLSEWAESNGYIKE